jgi:hypothetical protein
MEDGYVIPVALAVAVGVFVALREVVMWYWKINRMVELQEQQLRTLLEIHKLLKKDGEGGESAAS